MTYKIFPQLFSLTLLLFYSHTCLIAELVARWPLNEGKGEVFSEVIGGHDGFIPGGGAIPTWSEDTPDTGFENPYSLFFDHTKQNLVNTPFEGIEGLEPRTLSAWIKTESTASQAIIAYGARDGNGRKFHFRVNPDSGNGRIPGAIRTEVEGGNQTGTTNIADGEWHHVVSVFPGEPLGDNTEVMHYVDGVLEGETGTTDEFVDTGIGPDFPPVSIGARLQNVQNFSDFMRGNIDDVRIYNRALSVVEIQALASNPSTDGLVAHWPFDDGPESTQATETIAQNHGKLLTNITKPNVNWVNDGPDGIQDVSLEFTGDEGPSFVETTFPGISDDNARTVTMWVKADHQHTNTAMVAWGGLGTGEKWHVRIEQSNDAMRTEFSGGQNFGEILVADDDWHFVASVLPDGGEGADLMHFIDGEWDPATNGNSIPINTLSSDEGGFPVHLGWAAGHAGRWFDGLLADVRIYDEALDEEALLNIMNGEDIVGIPGDFNNDQVLDAIDIDLLTAESIAGTNAARFDLNGDDEVNNLDRTKWVTELRTTWFGDANLDGEFNSSDFVVVFQAGEYEDGIAQNSTWGTGDWNGDGEFDSSDFVTAFVDGGFEIGPRLMTQSIPEPHALLPTAIGILSISLSRRTRRANRT